MKTIKFGRLKSLKDKVKDWKEDLALDSLMQKNREHFAISDKDRVIAVHLNMNRFLLSEGREVDYFVGYGNANDLSVVGDLARYSVHNGREWKLDPTLFYVSQYFFNLRLDLKYLFSSPEESEARAFAHEKALNLANKISKMNNDHQVVDTSRDPNEILKEVKDIRLYSDNPGMDICAMKY
ncbi:MAG: hypothetical protein AABW91_01620 [Nanoarchaeota archaeon]